MKQRHSWHWLASALLAGAACQGAMAGTGSLPSVHQAGAVSYLTGGVGLDESQAIKQVMPSYPLVLEFSGQTAYGNEYLSGVPVKIVDTQGKTVLKTQTDGPFLLARLPVGRYSVAATYHDQTEHRTFDLAPHSHVREFFLWQM